MSTQTAGTINLGPAATITDGMRVSNGVSRNPQPVFLMINERAHLVSEEVSVKNLFGNNDSTPIQDLTVTIGAAIGDGYLAREDGSAPVYLVYDGFKRWIPSPDVFETFGFSWDLVRVVPPGGLSGIPNGPDVG
jgi:hypothetical protein